MSCSAYISLDRSGDGIVQIRLERPDRLNALGADMTDALLAVVLEASAGSARVIVLRGSGRAFCAGADLKERRTMDEAARARHNRAINAVCDALAAAPMPTIALINGLALGGGCELALACDLRYAAEDAQIGLTEARIGAIPGAGGTQRLPRVVGAPRALELMLTGEPVTGRRAAEIGLVHAAMSPAEIEGQVMRTAALIASRSPNSTRTIKALVARGMQTSLAEGLMLEGAAVREILASADYAEGLAAFAEKRPPRFTGGTST